MTQRVLPLRTLILGSFVSMILLAGVLWRVDVAGAWRVLMAIEAKRLLLPALVTLLVFPYRPWRWQTIFSVDSRPAWWSCFKVNAIANLCNNVLPARGGDFLRCFLIAREAKAPSTSAALMTVVVEKVLDGLGLLAIVIVSFIFISPPRWLVQTCVIVTIFFGLVILCLRLVYSRPERVQSALDHVFKRFGLGRLTTSLSGLVARMGNGLHGVRSPSACAVLTLQTVLTTAVPIALIWALTWVMRLPLGLAESCLISAVLGIGLMVPAAPAFIGSYEFFVVASLSWFGIDTETGLAFAVLLHAWVVITTTLLGTIALVAGGAGGLKAWIKSKE